MALVFEWDEEKAAINIRKHGIDFNDAKQVFEDDFAVDEVDDSMEYEEDRFIITGLMDGYLITVIYTERNDTLRLISARKASKYEERKYHSQQTPP